MNENKPFMKSGVARLSDLTTPEWKEIFAKLEIDQARFLSLASMFLSPENELPCDPLHTWSRVWEYPYVYSNIIAWRETLSKSSPPHIVDVGSGVTFLPFTLAAQGFHVTCTDVDPPVVIIGSPLIYADQEDPPSILNSYSLLPPPEPPVKVAVPAL